MLLRPGKRGLAAARCSAWTSGEAALREIDDAAADAG